jgi:hypothetical protein
VNITAAGVVTFSAGYTGNLSLSGINFMASDATFGSFGAKAAPTLQNSWANLALPAAPLTSGGDSLGRAHIQGILTPGATSWSGGQLAVQIASAHVCFASGCSYSGNIGGMAFVASRDATDTSAWGSLSATAVGAIGYRFGAGTQLSVNMMFYPYMNQYANLLSGSSSYPTGGIYMNPSFKKDSDGIVTMGGMTSIKSVVGTLPVGSRPSSDELFQALYVSLNNISFIAEQ